MTIANAARRPIYGCLLMMAATTSGCVQSMGTSPANIPADGIEQVAPVQIQRALSQLSASNARQQHSGLEFVERFPSLTRTHRDLIEHLARDGADSRVKQQASALLESNPAVTVNQQLGD